MTTEPLTTAHVPAPHAAIARGRVLIVDDEEPNRALLRDPLEAKGYEITEAENGPQALRCIDERVPDAILADVMMPGMDGFQLCRQLKRDPRTAHVPLLMVTALTERRERLLGIEAGANDFLNKPVDIQDLMLRVGNAIYTKSLFDQLAAERERSERLLLNTLPRLIAERMKRGEVNIADKHPDVTLMVADLVGFTALTSHIAPEQIVSLLNEIFSTFDLLVERHRLEKIKTVGDAYMVAGGLLEPRPGHADAVARLALDMRSAVAEFNRQYQTSVNLRVGISTGPVIAGVIGRKKFAFDLWGDTVNVACRLQSTGAPGVIQLSASTCEQLKEKYQFDGSQPVEATGAPQLVAYRLSGR